MTDHTPAPDSILDQVRAHYAAAALAVTNKKAGGCCSTIGSDKHPSASVIAPNEPGLGASQYDTTDLDQLPADAVLASLGCGNPTAVAELHDGQTVLDLGSGGGIDVLLSARRVGPTGHAYGLDMTDEMLDLARANQAKAGIANVHWLKGHIEAIPLPANSVDVVLSNCVINLSTDKPQVLRETARVLKPGGTFAVSDVIADPGMDDATRADVSQYVGCIAGALTHDEYTRYLTDAGLTDIEIVETHRVHEAAGSAIIRARKPVA